ncbi:hypothetical protein C8R48DRAFT_710793 [Suillus tomentosus]|nr:hypothetical protein C8R48DRAFT_710793 [Suillus tomentosus]
MSMFLSGPPGGQTLPQTATRLSDLDGGVFELGAIVASTDGILDYMKISEHSSSAAINVIIQLDTYTANRRYYEEMFV